MAAHALPLMTIAHTLFLVMSLVLVAVTVAVAATIVAWASSNLLSKKLLSLCLRCMCEKILYSEVLRFVRECHGLLTRGSPRAGS